jgi:cob(I)alamin adenosyltransferase
MQGQTSLISPIPAEHIKASATGIVSFGVKIYTKKGDDGTTGLLYGGRVRKDDPRTDVYGTLDETVSALGIARAGGLTQKVEEIVARVQREMFVVGAQLATAAENQSKLEEGVSKLAPGMTEQAESDIDQLLAEHPLRPEFVLPGSTMGSAGLDLARSTIRRAERLAVSMAAAGLIEDEEVLRYLNRVSDLLFALARFEEAERGVQAEPSRDR